MDAEGLSRLVRSRRTNAVVGWALVVLVCVTSLASLATGNLLWTVFAATVAVIALLPAVSERSVWVMPPWEVLLLATFPTIGHLFAVELLTGTAADVATYVSVAALALLIAVDLEVFTAVEMNATFATVFVIVATMATAGGWAVLRWIADLTLGTAYIHDEHALMLEFVASATAGLLAGLFYVFYVRRRANPDERVPAEVGHS